VAPGTVLRGTSLPLPEGEQVFGVAILDDGGAALVTADDARIRVRTVRADGTASWEHDFGFPDEIVLPSNPVALPGGGVAGFGGGGSVIWYALDADGGALQQRSLPHVNIEAAYRQNDGFLVTGEIDARSTHGDPFDFDGHALPTTPLSHEAFVARLDPSGHTSWVTPIEVQGEGFAIAADDGGNAYAFVAAGAPPTLYRLAPSGAVLWSVPRGWVRAVAVDGSGAPWVAGYADTGKAVDWLGLPAPPYQPCASAWGFVARLDASDGSVAWARTFEGPIRAVAGLEDDRVVVAGTEEQTLPPAEGDGDAICRSRGLVQALSPDGEAWHADLDPQTGRYPWAVTTGDGAVVVYATADDVSLSGRRKDGALLRIAR